MTAKRRPLPWWLMTSAAVGVMIAAQLNNAADAIGGHHETTTTQPVPVGISLTTTPPVVRTEGPRPRPPAPSPGSTQAGPRRVGQPHRYALTNPRVSAVGDVMILGQIRRPNIRDFHLSSSGAHCPRSRAQASSECANVDSTWAMSPSKSHAQRAANAFV
jgi:hypothetical protein